MSDLSFGIHILASMVAICGSYAIIMSIIKKEIDVMWVRGEAVITLIGAGISFAFIYTALFGGSDVLLTLSILFLILGLANSLALVILHRFKMKNDKIYHAHFIPIVRTLAIIMFISFTAHFFIELVALPSM